MERFSSSDFPDLGRDSAVFNEDDYDYALELRPDDEYRQAAELLPDIVDFDECELFLNDSAPEKLETRRQFQKSLSPEIKDYQELDLESGIDSETPKWDVVSRKEFSLRLNLLEKRRVWVQKAARKYQADKDAMNKFLVLLARGVHVRRHQSNRIAENVRLFSTTGCQTIQWEPPNALDLYSERKQKRGQDVDGETKAIFASTYDNSVFDCCIAVCGCGDDLIAGNNRHQQGGVNIQSFEDEWKYVGMGRLFHNFGYQYRGVFRDWDVLAVHPATKEDPTEAGMLATETLRCSKDEYVATLTFSVIIKDRQASCGVQSVDLECDTEDVYFTLLHGFKMLQEEAEARRARKEQEAEQNENLSRWERVQHFWMKTREKLFPDDKSNGMRKKKSADPIGMLFAPVNNVDPLRAFRVGGGLLPENRGRRIKSPSGRESVQPSAIRSQSPKLPPARFLGWKSAGTQIWARLKMAGLEVKCVFSWDLSRVVLKIRCPAWRLEEMAEQMHMKIKSRDGYLKPFKVSRRDTFIAAGAKGTIFRSSERQQIIDFIIRSKIKDGGAELDENTELGVHIVQRFPLHMYSRLFEIRHTWVTFWKREKAGEIAAGWSPFAESYKTTYNNLLDGTSYICCNLLTQPLDSIAEYFGESIAFYFAYMAFYTRWLVFPSVLGFIVFCFQLHDHQLDHWLCTPYAIVVMIWACFMLAFWRQKASALAFRWGVLDYEIEETERPQFQGNYTFDPATGELRKTYPLWRRLGKYLVSIPVLAGTIFFTLIIMTVVFTTQAVRSEAYAESKHASYEPVFPYLSGGYGHGSTPLFNLTSLISAASTSTNGKSLSIADLNDGEFWSVTFFYPCLYGFLVSIMTILFELIAIWLNDYENHRTQTTYMNRLILKVFSFQFVTIFTSLYYYAFFMRDREGAFTRMSVTIFSLMTVGQWWSILLDCFVPSIYHNALMYLMKANYSVTNRKIYAGREYIDKHRAAERRSSSSVDPSVAHKQLDKREKYLNQGKSHCWEEALQLKYNNFTDYTQMVIQIAFILLFSLVFPLAPLIALVNNIALIRFNAMKICYSRQRPIAQKIGGIGVWEDVLQVMSIVGVLTNCALVGVTSSHVTSWLVPQIGSTGMALVLFFYEQFILLFKYWLNSSIPRVPPSVQRAQTRERKSIDRKSFLRKQRKNGAAGKSRRSSTDNTTSGGGGGGSNRRGSVGGGRRVGAVVDVNHNYDEEIFSATGLMNTQQLQGLQHDIENNLGATGDAVIVPYDSAYCLHETANFDDSDYKEIYEEAANSHRPFAEQQLQEEHSEYDDEDVDQQLALEEMRSHGQIPFSHHNRHSSHDVYARHFIQLAHAHGSADQRNLVGDASAFQGARDSLLFGGHAPADVSPSRMKVSFGGVAVEPYQHREEDFNDDDDEEDSVLSDLSEHEQLPPSFQHHYVSAQQEISPPPPARRQHEQRGRRAQDPWEMTFSPDSAEEFYVMQPPPPPLPPQRVRGVSPQKHTHASQAPSQAHSQRTVLQDHKKPVQKQWPWKKLEPVHSSSKPPAGKGKRGLDLVELAPLGSQRGQGPSPAPYEAAKPYVKPFHSFVPDASSPFAYTEQENRSFTANGGATPPILQSTRQSPHDRWVSPARSSMAGSRVKFQGKLRNTPETPTNPFAFASKQPEKLNFE